MEQDTGHGEPGAGRLTEVLPVIVPTWDQDTQGHFLRAIVAQWRRGLATVT